MIRNVLVVLKANPKCFVQKTLIKYASRDFSKTTNYAAATIKPLTGVKVIELSGLAPVPHTGMMLADFGAEVTVVERLVGETFAQRKKKSDAVLQQRLTRGKKVIYADLKSKVGLETVKSLLDQSDVLLDPYRPAVLEKLGLDPLNLLEKNEKLIVCRLTGYGQHGPLAQKAGHDINYVAISGLLPTISGHGRDPLWPPANLLADFAGGALSAAFGIAAALVNRNKTGKGCIIDNSMVEGLAYMGSFINYYKDVDIMWNSPYSWFSGNCPIYRTYKTKDGKYIAVGALEPKFSKKLFEVLGLKHEVSNIYENPQVIANELEELFKTKTRKEWEEIFEDKDACVTPVLDIHEAADYHHNSKRSTFTKDRQTTIPNPAPRLHTPEEYTKQRD